MRQRVASFERRSRGRPRFGRIGVVLVFVALVVAIAFAVSAAAPSHRDTRTTRDTRNASRLIALTIAPQSHAAEYDRLAEFGGWTSQRGCQDTRAALLIRTSRAPVTYTNSHQCAVKTGRWTDPWSGASTTVAHDLHIDHTVPLQNAWVSGAWSWTRARRVAYANDLTDKDHLVVIDASENESKGADGPDEWRPPKPSTWCQYALAWDSVKAKWQLTATPSEWTALREMAAACGH